MIILNKIQLTNGYLTSLGMNLIDIDEKITSKLIIEDSSYMNSKLKCANCNKFEEVDVVYQLGVLIGTEIYESFICTSCALNILSIDNNNLSSNMKNYREALNVEYSEEQNIFTNEEEEQIKIMLTDSIVHFGTSFAVRMQELIDMDNNKYADGLLATILYHALKIERNSKLYQSMLKSHKIIQAKKETHGVEEKLKYLGAQSCELAKVMINETDNSFLLEGLSNPGIATRAIGTILNRHKKR